jgi:predicted Zn finger-like uncharacterized protein
MKIVCDACQAKYSIADDKIQGKAFKIRCKKCNHIIVVKLGAENAQGASVGGGAASERPRTTGSHAAAKAAEQPVWHIVVDGEQVGPLTESEIKDRLRQGKVNSDTLVWKEGFADWTQFSAVPELTPLLARITQHPVAKPAPREPQRPSAGRAAVSAPVAAAASDEPDPFAAPTVVSAAGTADLFASAMAAPAASPAPAASAAPAATSPFLFGGGAPAQPIEPVAARPSGGNGAGTTHLTGQRNENSVLFSLANLEALAVPAQSSNIRAPSASSNTEGSGLIDIRSMAAMTLADGPAEPRRSADVLPTFSTPQFSPVAPVILPMSTSGPPKWVYPVLAMLGIGIAALGIVIYTVANKPPPGLPPAPPPPPPAPAAVAPAAPAPAPAAAPAGEPSKPGEEKPAAAAAEEKPAEKGKSSSGRGERGRHKGESSAAKGGTEGKKGSEGSAASSATPSESGSGSKPSGRKGGKSLDDLLGEVGSNKKGSSGGEEPSKPAVKLVTLSQSDIVTAMKAVQPRIQACANQFKTPGTALANISVASGGRVSSATVTGKFAGTPTAGCVEQAARSAKFPPCQPMNFPWPFTLLPR